MPKIGYSKLPKREEEICLRVREVREQMKWKQRDFARELGIERGRLASYEYARAPIRYGLGSALCRKFKICQRWLATGNAPRSPYLEVDDVVFDAPPKSLLFSEVYDALYSEEIERFLADVSIAEKTPIKDLDECNLWGWPPLFSSQRDHLISELMGQLRGVEHVSHTAPIPALRRLISSIKKTLQDYTRRHGDKINELVEELSKEKASRKKVLMHFAQQKLASSKKK